MISGNSVDIVLDCIKWLSLLEDEAADGLMLPETAWLAWYPDHLVVI
jgi:hypothetical protein